MKKGGNGTRTEELNKVSGDIHGAREREKEGPDSRPATVPGRESAQKK